MENRNLGQKFVHLHIHDCYSTDAIMRTAEAVKKAQADGNPAIAVTNHGNIQGIFALDAACREASKNGASIRPIFGCEFYVAPISVVDKDPHNRANHLILLVKNKTGYRNLCWLSTQSYQHKYFVPRIDEELLEGHTEGLVCLSACVAGKIPQQIIQGRMDLADQTVQKYLSWFGEDFYLEVQNHGLPEERKVAEGVVVLAKKYGIKIVATNDAHYLNPEDAKAHETLLCIRNQKLMSEEHFSFQGSGYWLKTAGEMAQLFPEEWLTNTLEVAEKCQFSIQYKDETGYHLPVFENELGLDNSEFFRKKAWEGFEKIYAGTEYEEAGRKQLAMELDVIQNMGFVDYFLIVQDFINWAKRNDIPIGPGRGSGAGSIAANCLGITKINPLRFGLYFERFLNPERVSMPDFDIDMDIIRRGDVIRYVQEKYGAERVSQILTFSTFGPKQALKDVGKVLGASFAQTTAWTKDISENTLAEEKEKNPNFSAMLDSDKLLQQVYEIALRIEGNPKACSKHAAGILICDRPVVEYAALSQDDESSVPVIQATMAEVEALGLIKFDFLGLRNLTVIDQCLKRLAEKGISVDIDHIEEEKEVFEFMWTGKTADIFQLESGGMQKIIRQLKPDSIEDLTALVSLYRPGPIDSIPKYIHNKHNPGSIVYDDPRLKPILEITYGCLVYQEQVMKLFQVLAGYSMGQADVVRRAISKKKQHVLEEEMRNFVYGKKDENGNVIVPGAMANGIPEATCRKIMDEVTAFAAYAFNKAHAAAYAVIAYQTAWLKFHYPDEFLAEDFNSRKAKVLMEDISKVHAEGYEILPPSVNASAAGFSAAEGGGIRYGLSGIKNVGTDITEAIITERQTNGDFKSFWDFACRMQSATKNKKAYAGLILAGAFDWTGETRRTLFENYEAVLSAVKSAGVTEKNILTLIPDGEDFLAPQMERKEEFPVMEKLNREKEITGLFMSGHPMDTHMRHLNGTRAQMVNVLANPDKLDLTKQIIVGGCITELTIKTTKKKTKYAAFTLEDQSFAFPCVAFSQVLDEVGDILTNSRCVLIKGKLNDNGESLVVNQMQAIPEDTQSGLIVQNFVSFAGRPPKKAETVNQEKVAAVKEPEIANQNKPQRGLYFRVPREDGLKILKLAEKIKGNVPVYIDTVNQEGKRILYNTPNLNVSMRDCEILREIMNIAGPENVSIQLPTITTDEN